MSNNAQLCANTERSSNKKQTQTTTEHTQSNASKDVDLTKTIVKDNKIELSDLKPKAQEPKRYD